ncbi:Ankyrin repeat domain-containing protein [Hyphomicrobiales bacterium]|nr:Ankyrin repeat domain-containing protein [Hyphomicrobiales bacterium]CAH1698732.1 Ankyrin repeat domain-containing protein [Hyphomicrobiales bacterium]CAI0342380.1 Ankyrin repeat domain-containing protein [Hyphomicrobiales bacterium]
MARSTGAIEPAFPAPDRALLIAAYDADITAVIAALEDGANVNAMDPATGLSALHIAVGTNNLALTQILIEDWEATLGPDAKGRWPTMIAAVCRVDEALSDYIVEAESRAQY